MITQYTNTHDEWTAIYYHAHGKSFVYPDHADNVTLTSAAPAWSTDGDIIEVIPADTLTESAFDLHWIDIAELSGNSDFQIDVYAGAEGEEVLIGSVRTNRNSNLTREGEQYVQIPQQPSGTRISCKLSNSSASSETCTVSFSGHYYA